MEEESSVDPKAHAGESTFGETLVYDFAKFLTSLSLIALGGVLSLTQAAAGKATLKPFSLLLVLAAISLAGVIGVTCANALVEARAFGGKPRKLRLYISASMALLGIGTGGFLKIWWDTLH